jgi:Lrp/AsnC family transcriptional regulator, regulator for asnA, asnC and gidA
MSQASPRQRPRARQPDALDRQIIRLLRADGRCSTRAIARRLEIPEATIRYRLRRLRERGILTITAAVDPAHLGYAVTALISLQVELEHLSAVAAQLAALPVVSWAAVTIGAHDLVLLAAFRDKDELFQFVTVCLARIAGLQRIEVSVARWVFKQPHEWASEWTAVSAQGAAGDEPGP